VFSDWVFTNGLFTHKTRATRAVPAANVVVIVSPQVPLFAVRTSN
jgi:hypothetical protein